MNYPLYEKVFLAVLTGYVQRNGIMFADENAFTAVSNNVDGLARSATRVLLRMKDEMVAETPIKAKP